MSNDVARSTEQVAPNDVARSTTQVVPNDVARSTTQLIPAYMPMTLEDHKKQILGTRIRVVNDLFEHAQAIYRFKQACKKEKEGTFEEKLFDWVGYSLATAHEWVKIAKHAEKFKGIETTLPSSKRTIYELAALPAEQIVECLKEKRTETRLDDVISYKKRLAAPPPPPKTEEPKTIDAQRAEWVAQAEAQKASDPKTFTYNDPANKVSAQQDRDWDLTDEEIIERERANRPTCIGIEGTAPGQYTWLDPVVINGDIKKPGEWVKNEGQAYRPQILAPTNDHSKPWSYNPLWYAVETMSRSEAGRKLLVTAFNQAFHSDKAKVEANDELLGALKLELEKQAGAALM